MKGLITLKDINKSKDYPSATKDSEGRLLVAAAIGNADDTEERTEKLAQAGVDVLVVDSAHGHSQGILERVKKVKKDYPNIEVIGGNVATADAATALMKAGADGVKVGIGPGSICTTRIVTGVGVPQITAIADVVSSMKKKGIPVIADGGIRFSGDFAKAIAAGADSVMLGSILAGTEEAPGQVELFQGRMLGGLRQSMGYTGCKDIDTMKTKPKFVQITTSGMSESHVHDVSVTKEAPNYRIT